MNRIDQIFKLRRASGSAAMIFYVTVGYPDIETTETVIDELARAGTDIVEIGMPFSDPMADGPTIQQASAVALEGGVTTRQILEMIARVRKRHPRLGLLIFSAYNPIFHFGQTDFVRRAARAGADGLMIPDLPPEQAGELRLACARHRFSTVFFVAPTTTPERIDRIAEASTGFIYYFSLKGVTGARDALPEDLEQKVRALKARTQTPVAVGFGISKPEQARRIAGFADGVIVGSALIRIIGDRQATEPLPHRVAAYARAMVAAAAGDPSVPCGRSS